MLPASAHLRKLTLQGADPAFRLIALCFIHDVHLIHPRLHELQVSPVDFVILFIDFDNSDNFDIHSEIVQMARCALEQD